MVALNNNFSHTEIYPSDFDPGVIVLLYMITDIAVDSYRYIHVKLLALGSVICEDILGRDSQLGLG